MTTTRWLVPHDFSETAQRAAEQAASELAPEGGTLVLLNVRGVPPIPMGLEWMGGNAVTPVWSDLQASWLERAEHALEEVGASLADRHAGLRVEVRAIEGRPAEAILHAADELGVDRIVLGTHGHTGLKHALLGSVAEKVVRLAHVPVLVVKADDHEPRGGER